MIAVDTNILVYAHRADSPFHTQADRCLTTLAESGKDWAIPWPCVHEFLAIVTHPRIYLPPTPMADALEQVSCWLASPSLHLLGETDRYWEMLHELATKAQATGPFIHDVRIAALCLLHRVTRLWTADRDFSRFQQLKVENPLR